MKIAMKLIKKLIPAALLLGIASPTMLLHAAALPSAAPEQPVYKANEHYVKALIEASYKYCLKKLMLMLLMQQLA